MNTPSLFLLFLVQFLQQVVFRCAKLSKMCLCMGLPKPCACFFLVFFLFVVVLTRSLDVLVCGRTVGSARSRAGIVVELGGGGCKLARETDVQRHWAIE